MLELDVKVERYIAPVDFVTVLVRTGEVLLYLNSKTSVFLSIFEFVKAVILLSKSLICDIEGT